MHVRIYLCAHTIYIIKVISLINIPVLSNCAKVLHPIDIASVGTSDIPNLASADTSGYRLSTPKNVNGKYETKYIIAPAAAPALAVRTQTVYHTYTQRDRSRRL